MRITFQMDLHLFTLFQVLTPSDQVKLALCNHDLLQRCPISKLYYTNLPHMNCDRVRRMSYNQSLIKVLPKMLTHVILVQTFDIANFADLTNLVHLNINQWIHDLVLRGQLRTFIGANIHQNLTLPQSLTHLTLHGKPQRIVGLDNHPNLTILRVGFDLKDVTVLPPNLVEIDTTAFPIGNLPETLRIIRVARDYEHHPQLAIPNLPAKLEELHFTTYYLPVLPNLPTTLRSLTLIYFDEMEEHQVSECRALTKIVMPFELQNQCLRDSLCKIANFIPQVTDLRFKSSIPSGALKDVQFSNLRFLRLDLGHLCEEPMLKFGHLTSLVCLEMSCGFSQSLVCKVELPRSLTSLKLLQMEPTILWSFAKNRFSIHLPGSLRVLHIHCLLERHTFDIGISRQHLAKLKIVGDRGHNEIDGHISTKWGQFLLL